MINGNEFAENIEHQECGSKKRVPPLLPWRKKWCNAIAKQIEALIKRKKKQVIYATTMGSNAFLLHSYADFTTHVGFMQEHMNFWVSIQRDLFLCNLEFLTKNSNIIAIRPFFLFNYIGTQELNKCKFRKFRSKLGKSK